MIKDLPQSLIDTVTRILMESSQSNLGFQPNKVHKPSKDDARLNREDPVWEHALNLNGSSILYPHTDVNNLKMEHLFYREPEAADTEGKHEYAIVEDVRQRIPESSIKKLLISNHFVTRLAERNNTSMTGNHINDVKDRIIGKIDEDKLVDHTIQHSEGKPRSHTFTSTKIPETKGSTFVTKIRPDGTLHFVTYLSPLENGYGRGTTNSLIEDVDHESIYHFID